MMEDWAETQNSITPTLQISDMAEKIRFIYKAT